MMSSLIGRREKMPILESLAIVVGEAGRGRFPGLKLHIYLPNFADATSKC